MVRFLLLTTCIVAAAAGCTCDPADDASTHISCRMKEHSVCSTNSQQQQECEDHQTLVTRHMKAFIKADGTPCVSPCKKGDLGVTLDQSEWSGAGHKHKCVHIGKVNGIPACKCCDCANALPTAAPTQAPDDDAFTPTQGKKV